jgi:hypothetical protein
MNRQRLPDRRQHQVFNLEHEGHRLVVGTGRFDDGRLLAVVRPPVWRRRIINP